MMGLMILDLDRGEKTSLSPGDKILVPGLFGDYHEMTMGDFNLAKSENGMYALIKYNTESKRFHVAALFDSRRINRLDF